MAQSEESEKDMTDISSATFEGWSNRETYHALAKIDNEEYLHTALSEVLLASVEQAGSDFDRLRYVATRMREVFGPIHDEYNGKVRWHELAGWLVENRLPEMLGEPNV